MPSAFQAPVYDPHVVPRYDITSPQLTLFIVWLTAILVWLTRNLLNRSSSSIRRRAAIVAGACSDAQASSASSPVKYSSDDGGTVIRISDCGAIVRPAAKDTSAAAAAAVTAKCGTKKALFIGHVVGNNNSKAMTPHVQHMSSVKGGAMLSPTRTSSNPFPCLPSVDDCLLQIIWLGGLMMYFYMCDYRKVFPTGERVYDRDTFLFLLLVLLFISCAFTLERTPDKILNRDQTDEWKGWMQVMFVWYHYFAAKELYSWIRVYIACYVWITGFGNFSYYWLRKDYSVWRLGKMLFRLNFSVLVICSTVSNAYMVYYICAMHTYWFLSVYATMATFSSYNGRRTLMIAKFVLYAVFNALVFDLPGTSDLVFHPLTSVLGLQMPGNSSDTDGILREWTFRAGLDHWSCFVGMLCAYNYSHWESFIRRIEADKRRLPVVGLLVVDVTKSAILFVVIGASAAWYVELGVARSGKVEYNRHHPYSSPIPIIAFIVVRNLWPTLRTHYLRLFAWLGKITLETYLCQLHAYLQSNAKHRIAYVDHSRYPLVNFFIATAIYLFLSVRLFHISNALSAFFLPPDAGLLRRRCGLALVVVVIAAITAATFVEQLSQQ